MTSYMQAVKTLIVVSDLNKDVNTELFKPAGGTELVCFVKRAASGEGLQKDITRLCKKKFWITKATGKFMESSLLRDTKYKATASGLGSFRATDSWRVLLGALFCVLRPHLLPHVLTAAR